MTDIDRRTFLTRGAVVAGAATFASGPLAGLLARAAGAAPGGAATGSQAANKHGDYGPLEKMGDLWLPKDFRYVRFGEAGTELYMNRTDATPAGTLPRGHDGMASFAVAAGLVRLIRNHENRGTPVSPLGGAGYNPARFGGTTTMEFDTSDPVDRAKDATRFKGQWVSIQGTSTNCAGGPTPWQSWMTCEETTETDGSTPHGYIFDVPASANGPVAPVALRAMGRFSHEAVAIDPRTKIAYETEDGRILYRKADGTLSRVRGDGPVAAGSGFYRFTPSGGGAYGTIGTLEMLAVKGRPNYNTTSGQRVGEVLPVTWVPVPRPDPADMTNDSPFLQGWSQGGAVFNRLEGAWYSDGSIFFISTNGGEPHPAGDPGLGQVWQYTPRGESGGQLVLLVESRDPAVMEAPDNITVSPRGGLLACEDGEGEQFLRGITRDGRVFDFATHEVPYSATRSGDRAEFAGANWSPDGNWLFVNIQDPGMTYAITGPWERGAL